MNIQKLPYKAESVTGTKKFLVDNRYVCYIAKLCEPMNSVWDGNNNITDTELGSKIICHCILSRL